MSEYSELKHLADAATQGKWCTDGARQVMSAESDQLNSGFVIVDCQGPDNLKNAAFIAAANPAAILALVAEIDQLKGLMPDWPPRPPDGEGLPRYGLRWNGPQQPLAVPMNDGYWTPWHLAHQLKAEVDSLTREADRQYTTIEAYRKDAERYRWLCERFGVTKLPCAIERIIDGDVYVADGKAAVDVAIDAAMSQGEQP